MTDYIEFEIEREIPSWDIIMDGQQREILEKSFSNIEDEERSKIFSTAAKILSNCSNPNETEGNSIGLGLGKIQSGKTSSFITLCALAIDNGIKVIIILAGSKINLLKQTYSRIREQFGSPNNGIAFLTTAERIQSIRSEDVLRLIRVGKSIVITVLKHQDHIDHLSEVFSSPELRSLPTLIIDDEGDQASLNNRVRRNERSTVYSSISNLRARFLNHSYVAFTATPQGNLLISTLDELRPNFCVLIEPGRGYTGGSTFHGINEGLYNISVPDGEVGFDDAGEEGIPQSLQNALATFFVGAAIRHLRGDNEKHSMLIHTSRSRTNHQNIDVKLKSWLERWNQVVELDSQDPARGNFNNVMIFGYDELSRTVTNMPSWEEVLAIIKIELIDHQILKVNSDRDAEKLMDDMNFRNNIFVGGNMLERGVTLPGLAVTYITRRANTQQADTVEQRARWFGYKGKYLDTCRIWSTNQIRHDFMYLLGHEDEIWQSLILLEEENIDLPDWTVILKASAQFRPTRASVATARPFLNLRNMWLFNRRPANDEITARDNVNITENFFTSNGAQAVLYGGIEHKIIYDCPPNYVIEELIKKISKWEETDWNLPLILDLFNKLERTGQFNGLNVVRISSNYERKRTFINGVIGKLQQGRSQYRDPGDPLFYPGDANILPTNQPQLQVQFLKPSARSTGISPDITVIVLALYITDELADAVGPLVRAHD